MYQTVKQASKFGVEVQEATVNFENMLARKEDIVNQMYQGVKHLMQHNHIDIYNGTGRILGTSIFHRKVVQFLSNMKMVNQNYCQINLY